MTSLRYRDLLVQHMIHALQERNCVETTFIMQNGAVTYVDCQMKDMLRVTLTTERIISIGLPD